MGRLRGEFQRPVAGVLTYELIPLYKGEFKGAPLVINRWGMRDKDYRLTPPKNTYRIALLGSSMTMGAGVPQEQTHEALLEDRLNREGPGAPKRHYEILNFAVAGYTLLQNVAVMDTKVFPFAPNGVVLVVHAIDEERNVAHLVRLVRENQEIEYPYIRQKLKEAGVEPSMQPPELRRRIARVGPDILRWSLEHVAQTCREHKVPLEIVLFEEARERRNETRFAEMAAAVRAARIPLLDLKGVYGTVPLDQVRLDAEDAHLNQLGHKLVAERLFNLLRDNDGNGLKIGFKKKL